jgi:hypothetical protein
LCRPTVEKKKAPPIGVQSIGGIGWMTALDDFVEEATNILNLASRGRVEPAKLAAYGDSQRRRRFLQDLVARIRVIARAFDRLDELTGTIRQINRRWDELPHVRGTRRIPDEYVKERKNCETDVEAAVALIYYEVKSVVDMLRQLDIDVDGETETMFLLKVRDRFLSHPQLAGASRGSRGGIGVPFDETRRLTYDMIALNSWAADEDRALGFDPETTPADVRTRMREENEKLILSPKRNEQFSDDEITRLRYAGVRECDLEKVAVELAELLWKELRPILARYADEAMREFGLVQIPRGLPRMTSSWSWKDDKNTE